MKGMVQGVPRLINVPERAELQSPIFRSIQPCRNIFMGFVQKSLSRTQWAIGVSTGWRGRAVGVPSLVTHRRLHFIDGAVNFANGAVPLADKSRAVVRLQ
jgi:hypothetical protein